jgi:hypothetical protein
MNQKPLITAFISVCRGRPGTPARADFYGVVAVLVGVAVAVGVLVRVRVGVIVRVRVMVRVGDGVRV